MSESAGEPGEIDRVIDQKADVSGGGTAYLAARDITIRTINEYYQTDPGSAEAALPVEWQTHLSTRLVGRDADFAALAAALDPERDGPHTVLLTTPRFLRGIGRTSLARAVAQHARARGWFPGGIYYADARGETPDAPIDTVRFCPMLLVQAIGIDVSDLPRRRDQQLALYEREFAKRTGAEHRMLVIIDGVATRKQIDTLHPHGDHRVLVIPDQHLANVHDVSEVSIVQLGQRDAVAMLREAVGTGDGHFAGDGNAHKLERIASLVGGVPGSLHSIARYVAANPGADISDVVRAIAHQIDAESASPGSELLTDVVRNFALGAPLEFAATAGLAARTAITRWITDDWVAGRPARWEIVGDSGYGKSTLFKVLANRLRLDGGAIVLISGEVLSRTLEAAPGAEPDIVPFCRTTVEGIATDLEGTVSRETVQALLKISREGESPASVLTDTVARLSGQMTGADDAPRFAFLIDNLDGLADERGRSWLLELATALACPLAVSLHPSASAGIHAALRLPLTPLSAHHLTRMADISSEQATRVVSATDGRPAHIAVLLEQIKADPGNADLLLTVYEARARNEGLGVAHLAAARQNIDAISRAAIGRPEAEIELFDLLAVLRRFDAETVSALLAEHDLDEHDADRLMDGLRGSPVITDLDEYSEYEMHSLFREAQLGQMSGRHLRTLHQRVEKVIFSRLEEYDPESGKLSDHAGWSKYEDPFWRSQILEWFHHATHGHESEIGHDTLIRLALLYFEAFWWYGAYVGLDVCDDIAKEAVRITGGRTTSDLAWAEAISDVNTYYPRGWDPASAAPEAWLRVADGLRHLLGRTARAVDADHEDDEAGRLAMYLNNFLADCARYSPDSVSGTAAAYRDAARSLGRTVLTEDDAWIFAWFDLYDAETCLDRHDPRGAGRYLDRIRDAENPEDDVDEEVRARYELALARVSDDAGRPREAVTHAVAAVLRAYVYNVFQETTKQSPNLYTRTLHEECLAYLVRVLERTRGSARAGAAADIQGYFAPYWRDRVRRGEAPEWTTPPASAEPAEIVAYFAPALPSAADIGITNTPFARRVEHVRDAMEAELAWPPARARLPRQRGWSPRRAISMLLRRT